MCITSVLNTIRIPCLSMIILEACSIMVVKSQYYTLYIACNFQQDNNDYDIHLEQNIYLTKMVYNNANAICLYLLKTKNIIFLIKNLYILIFKSHKNF